jgi:hypothetical protein
MRFVHHCRMAIVVAPNMGSAKAHAVVAGPAFGEHRGFSWEVFPFRGTSNQLGNRMHAQSLLERTLRSPDVNHQLD